MKDLLVGSTGFVGGNLRKSHIFEAECHSTDVREYYRTEPDLCVYAGVPATMFLANSAPDADLAVVREALENIHEIRPKRLVLISTVAVYDKTKGVTEEYALNLTALPAYGRNRAQLEQWVRTDYPEAVIVRLPAIYGAGIKKNFLYDLYTITPAMLKREKYEELSRDSLLVKESYIDGSNGFYKLSDKADRIALRSFFEENDFNALSFTDSRSRYQFYYLGTLWDDICKILEAGIKIMNLATPPVSAGEIYQHIIGKTGWENYLPLYYDYDIRTVNAGLFGGQDGYICSMDNEINNIVGFMKLWK